MTDYKYKLPLKDLNFLEGDKIVIAELEEYYRYSIYNSLVFDIVHNSLVYKCDLSHGYAIESFLKPKKFLIKKAFSLYSISGYGKEFVNFMQYKKHILTLSSNKKHYIEFKNKKSYFDFVLKFGL